MASEGAMGGGSVRGAVVWLLSACGLLFAFCSLGGQLGIGFPLDLGRSLNTPSPGFGRFVAFWMLLGSMAALALTAAAAKLDVRWWEQAARAWRGASDRKWILYGSVFGFLIPAALRQWLLLEAPLTDDEAAYRLAAEILAEGRLYLESPPMKVFFDNRFLINDGKLYACYFLGWPALMVPGVWLGSTGYLNAVYSALTVPAVFLVARRLVGREWAGGAVLLYLLSPMLMIGAATELSHTSCTMTLAWLTQCVLWARDEPHPKEWIHGVIALLFSASFFIRPSSALGLGAPLLVYWGLGLRSMAAGRARRALLAFALPAATTAALFLAVNKAQNGSFFEVGYQRLEAYAAENDYRFALRNPGPPVEPLARVRHAAGMTGAAIFRLNTDLYGWPFSLLFVFFGLRGARRRWLGVSIGGHFALHLMVAWTVGIDTFAPMHYFEVAWPLLILTVAGLEAMTATVGSWVERGAATRGLVAMPVALAAAFAATTAVAFLPVKLASLHRLAANIALPRLAVEAAGLQRAVIFASDPFVSYCRSAPTSGWVFARPNNRPAFDNDPLWVNHVSLEADRSFIRRYPDRVGYVQVWDRACRVHYVRLGGVGPEGPSAPETGGDAPVRDPA